MRNILHDWPDEKARLILQNQVSAMDKGSHLLIDDIVIPNIGARAWTTRLDFTMLALLGAQERSEEDWIKLLDSVGLKIVKIYPYIEDSQESVILAVLQ
jgi:demethylsterigmatocystin 6-O-methyltransferase